MTTWSITCHLLIILGERFIQEMVHGYKDKAEDLYEKAKDTVSNKLYTKI